ncbi:hypothetical protein KJ782_04785, partial [Patescibacteria group bacterium]|nr:hypothetical protein [Patescibacteria group bacterium]
MNYRIRILCLVLLVVVSIYWLYGDKINKIFKPTDPSVTTDTEQVIDQPELTPNIPPEYDLNFGTLYVGDKNQLRYRHYNESNESQLIQLRSDSGCFTLDPPAGEYSVKPYEISIVTVTYTPMETGIHQTGLIIGSDIVTCFGSSVIGPTRCKVLQPFSSTSIWNHPIGDSAVYVPAGLHAGIGVGYDTDHFCYDGQKQLLFSNEEWPGVCKGDHFECHVWIPDWYIIPERKKNNAIGFLLSDGHSIYQGNPSARCTEGKPVYIGWPVPGDPIEDIYGTGITGGHGGSGLSGVGGTIRLNEITSEEPIRHALKIDIEASRYCSAETGGYRWPAWRADSYALDPDSRYHYDYYGTASPSVMMGSLLALHPEVKIDELGLQTYAAYK